MAKQTGMYKLRGTIGDITFCRTMNGYIAQEKTKLNAERIAKDPKFKRTRENGVEFGSICKSGKLLRDAISQLLSRAHDNRTTSRLTQLMAVIKNLDTTNVRGKRNVATGLGSPEGQAALKGFNFNQNAQLDSLIHRPLSIDPFSGVISIVDFTPESDTSAPVEATHVSFQACWAQVDFATGVYETAYSNIAILALDAPESTVVLTPEFVPSGTGNNLLLLHVTFVQELNGVLYNLQGGTFNALAIVEVG